MKMQTPLLNIDLTAVEIPLYLKRSLFSDYFALAGSMFGSKFGLKQNLADFFSFTLKSKPLSDAIVDAESGRFYACRSYQL